MGNLMGNLMATLKDPIARPRRASGKLENTYLYLFAFIIKKAKKKLHILFLLNFQLV
jgi:hypothetical protein